MASHAFSSPCNQVNVVVQFAYFLLLISTFCLRNTCLLVSWCSYKQSFILHLRHSSHLMFGNVGCL
uniref:Uncharacterized protein n=1 Tax=Anguilla anguilla TaxID=7936 RepID=A0A0E9UT21_ANGAN